MSSSSRSSDLRGLILKTLLALCIPIVLFALIGCVPEEPLEKDWGPQAKVSDIDQALRSAVGPMDFSKTFIDEFASRQQWVDIQGQNSLLQGENSIQVLEREETENEINFLLAYTKTTYDENGDPSIPNAREFPISICKVEDCSTENIADPSSLGDPILNFQSQQESLWLQSIKGQSASEPEITYHNLKVKQAVIEPPKQIRNSLDCRGLSPCQLEVTIVTYDSVVHLGKDETQVFQNRLISSTDLPLLSRYKIYLTEKGELAASISPLSYCQTYAIGATPVRLCEDLVDFIPGKDTTED